MVFISYKSEEYDIARRLRLMLEDHYYSCWMAPESIPGGSNYMHEIPKAIRKCDLFLLIVSETSQQSQWVQKEIDRAVKFNKQIIPFHVDDSELIDAIDFVISNAQRIEAYHNFDEACEELLEAVRRAHPPVKGPDGQTAAQAPKTEKKPTEDASAPAGVNPALLAALAAGNSNLPPDVLMQLLDKLPPEYVAQMIPGYNAQNAAKPAEPAPIPEPELIMDVQTWDEDPFAFLDGDQGISAQTWDEDPFAITEIEELPPEPAPEPKPEPVAPAEQPKPAPEIPAEPAPAPAP
ncbi:MAG: toll/interleukin-1 receptor domain-containing protein, partial [Clostridia bacterium]|nr:toll/interleukin-1 receptor domain-containing protein [Clostridia bacterium]